MRPGQNKRMRGRNPGRKGPNPLTRSYESNGPDVKIRGTAQHVAEKYLQLARDAQSSGDRVMAESYLQHAEHYFRIIAAAQQAQQAAQMGQARVNGSDPDLDDGDDDGDLGLSDRFASVAERLPPQPVYTAPASFQPEQNFANQPQPYSERPRPNNDRPDRQNFGNRPNYNGGDRNDRPRGDRPYQDRPYQNRPYQERSQQDRPYQERPYQDRNAERPQHDRQGEDRQGQFQDRGQDRGNDRGNRDPRRFRNDRPERHERPDAPPAAEAQNEGRRVGPDTEAELPAFIRAPVPARVLGEPEAATSAPTPATDDPQQDFGEGGGFHLRARRRRRGRPAGENDVPDTDEVPVAE
jgi:hypothetical protein